VAYGTGNPRYFSYYFIINIPVLRILANSVQEQLFNMTFLNNGVMDPALDQELELNLNKIIKNISSLIIMTV
jgi:hypothetical protein